MSLSVDQLWQSFCDQCEDAPSQPPISFHFCDNPADAATCLDLVLKGRKRATASSLAELERSNDPVPEPGDLAIVTDWDGTAHAVIRTTRVDIVPFGKVTEDFARAEGEGDLTLAWWRDAHRAYYERVLDGSGVTVDDTLPIACEHFEVIFSA